MNELTFKSHTLTPIIIKNKPYLGVGQIDLALQYPKHTTCRKIYERHADEFTPEMSFLTSVDTAGGKQQVRVFSLRGCHLLAMFSKTPVAKEFRRWVLDLIEQRRQEVDKTVIVSEHIRSLPSGKKEIVLSEKAKTEIGGIVKSVLQAEITQRENIRDVIREVIREEIAPYLLKDGIKEGTFNTSPTADGLPAVNWVIGISHGATALYNLIQQYQKCLREKNDLLLSENADLKNRMKQISSWVR